MNIVVLLALIGGTCARIPALIIQAKRSNCSVWKVFPFTVLLTLAEFGGTMLLFYVENGYFAGMSYYGGILLMPISCIILAWLFQIPYLDVMDMCGASAGGMLAVMRLQCVYFGCCKGIEMTIAGNTFAFPSPVVELTTVLILMCIILWLGKDEKKYKGKLFPIYLILYGSTRFVLNWFRSGNQPFVWILPPGNFWSIVAILIGSLWLYAMSKTAAKKAADQEKNA